MTPLILPAIFAQLGDWKYFTTVMRLADAAEHVQFAEQINEIRPGKQLSDLIQRALSGPRGAEIANYMTTNEDHFFNALVVAVYGGDPTWSEFSVNPGPLAGNIEVPTWAQSAFGFLTLSGKETLFALDGQHRLAGIREALKVKPALGDERISVLFVSHKKTQTGRRRTRKLFTTLNKTAVKVGPSDIIALDETDTAAIITRRLVEEHPYFSRGQILVRYGTANLAADDVKHFMTIITLYNFVSYINGYIVNSFDQERRAKLRYRRPDDDELEKYYQLVAAFFEKLVASAPELKAYFSAPPEKTTALLKKARQTDRQALFRAVGLQVHLRIIKQLTVELGDWRKAIDVAVKLPRRFTDVPYRDILYSVAEAKIITTGRTRLVTNLLLWMLGRYKDKAGLAAKYAEVLGKPVDKVRLPSKLP